MRIKLLYLAGAIALLMTGYLAGVSEIFSTNTQQLHATEKTDSKINTAFSIDDYINTFDMSEANVSSKGFQFWYVPKTMSKGLMNLKLSHVKAMQANHAPHKHPEEEIFMLIEGTAEFYLDGESRKVPVNSSLYCPPNVMHGIRNVGDTPIKYLVIKSE